MFKMFVLMIYISINNSPEHIEMIPGFNSMSSCTKEGIRLKNHKDSHIKHYQCVHVN